MKAYVGVDIGGTNVVIGLLDESMNLLERVKLSTVAAEGPERVLDRIATSIQELIQPYSAEKQIQAIGIGVPGFVDHVEGISVLSVNLHWKHFKVAEGMLRRTGLPTYINNDVRMYVYGEALRGSGRGYDHVLGVTVGTGLAAGIVSEGQVYHGGGNMAGELGHLPFEEIPYRCGCGLQGCIETIASATGLVRQAKALIAQGRSTRLEEHGDQLQAKHVSEAYDQGDEVAREVMHTTGRLLGKTLAYAVTMISPDVVIVGGGVAAAGERLMIPVREAMQANMIPAYWGRIRVVTASLGDDAGVIGSACYARERRVGS